MEQNQTEYLTLELSFKIQMRNYRIALGAKRAWIIALVLGMIRLVLWYLGQPNG